VPLTIAAATLPWIYSMVLSGLALSGYTALLIWYHPLHLQGVEHEALMISLHLFGMWLNFALSAAFITFFVVKMAGALRRQDQLQADGARNTCVTSNCWPWPLRPLAPPTSWARRWRP